MTALGMLCAIIMGNTANIHIKVIQMNFIQRNTITATLAPLHYVSWLIPALHTAARFPALFLFARELRGNQL